MAKAVSEVGGSRKAAAKTGSARAAESPRRQRLWRDLALIVVAPLLEIAGLLLGVRSQGLLEKRSPESFSDSLAFILYVKKDVRN